MQNLYLTSRFLLIEKLVQEILWGVKFILKSMMSETNNLACH